jgi:hypothetical protein
VSSITRRLHVIAACTDRKTLPIQLRFGKVAAGRRGETRAKTWWRALRSLKADTRPALDTYAGDHWSVVRSLPHEAWKRGWHATLWVLSAGYGLLPAETLIHGYSATFAYGHNDSVGKNAAEIARWWAALSKKPLDGRSQPRSLTQLFRQDPSAAFLIVGSPNYLRAVEADLLRGIKAASREPRVVIVSSTSGLRATGLAQWLVPSGRELQHNVHGGRVSLHARVARLIVRRSKSHDFHPGKVQKLCNRLARPGSGRMPVRTTQSDADVRAFVREALRKNASASYTALLRRLRDSGRACEMRRFKRLYSIERRTTSHVT